MNINDLSTGLPGGDLVRRGLNDYAAGRCTAESYLVQMARPRLARCGLLTAEKSAGVAEPHLELYRLLRQEGGDAYARYNALLGELNSFGLALDRRVREAAEEKAKEIASV